MNAGESTSVLALSCKLVDWGEAGNGIFLLVSGGSLLRSTAGSLLTHASQTEAQTLPAQSKPEWDLRLQAWGSPGYLGRHERGLNSPPKGMCMQAWGRRLGLEWVFSCYWLPCEWRPVGGMVSIQYSCRPYFKTRVENYMFHSFQIPKVI